MSPPTSPDEQVPAGATVAEAVAVAAPSAVSRTPQQVCADYGSAFHPPAPHDKAAVALETLHLMPLNLRRVTPEGGHCGWVVWGGEGRTGGERLFQPLTVAKLLERCPQLLPLLALAPGWQVQVRPDDWRVTPPHATDKGTGRRTMAPGPYRARPQPVTRYVVLSILLHLLAISLLGDTGGDRNAAAGGRAQPAGGAFSVSLQGPQALAAAPEAAISRAASSEPSRRSRRPASAKTAPEAVAPTVAPAEVPVETAAAPTSTAAEPAIAAEPLMPALISTPVDKAVTEFVVPLVVAEQPSPVPARPIEPLPALEPLTTPRIRQDVAVPAELEPRLAPLTAPKLAPSVAVPAELIPRLAPIAPVRIERDTAVPAELVQRLAPIEPLRVNQETAVPAELLPRLAPLATPKIDRQIAVPAELVPRLSPMASPPLLDRLPTATFAPPAVTATPAAGDASTAAPPPRTAERLRDDGSAAAARAAPTPAGRDPAGSAATDSDIFTRRGAGPPGSAGSGEAPPRIDLDQVRRRARELAGESSGPRTLLPFPTVKPPEDTRSKTQQAFDKALKRPDCRDVYAAMGLAAVVPLVLDAVTEKGCKW